MSIEFTCQQCGRQLRTADDTAGKKARCPACGNVQSIPSASSGLAGSPVPTGDSRYGFADAPLLTSPSPFGPSEKSNPFAEPASPWNPYAAPTYPGAYQFAYRSEAYALNRVQGPAMALIFTFGIAFAFSLISAVMFLVLIAQGEAEPGAMLQFAFSLPLSIFVLYGAHKMRRLEQYPMAISAAIVALIPCSGCCVLGVPFGIWALIVLNDAHVRDAFH